MQSHDSALDTTVTETAGSASAPGLLSDADVDRLGALNAEFYPPIKQAKSAGAKQAAREYVRHQIEERLKAEGHQWADVWAHAVVHDYILHDAKYRVMLDWFNDWVTRIDKVKALDRFTGAERVGAGGFGVVYKAYDPSRKSWVAIKVPHVPHEQMPGDRDTVTSSALPVLKFFEEARKHATIAVQGCVPLFDNGIPESQDNQVQVDQVLAHLRQYPIWFSMQLVEGRSLENVLRPKTGTYAPGKTMTDKEVIDLMTHIAEILKNLHASRDPGGKGYIIHKDLKPANILLDTQDQPWLTDFGLATPRGDQTVFRNPISGTAPYMAPELWRTEDEANYANAQTDIWAWGVIFHELLVGRRPFPSTIGSELREHILYSDAESPRVHRPKIAEYLDRIILKCLKRERRDRFECFAAVLAALKSRDDEAGPYRPPLQDASDTAIHTTGPSVSINDLKYRQRWLEYVQNAEVERQLDAFFDDPRPFLWWSVIGPGGVGKSRLAYERVLRLNHDGHWQAGFLRDDEDLASNWLIHKCPNWRPQSPTLIVVDYSARFSQALFTCLLTLSSQKWQEVIGVGSHVRLLFLDRPGAQIAPMAMEKLFDANSYDAKREAVRKFLFGASPATPRRDLPGQPEPIVREEELLRLEGMPRGRWREVILASAAKAGFPTLHLKPDDDRDWWDRIDRLSDGGRPLLLQILGVCLARRAKFVDDLSAGEEGLEGLLDEMLEHERTHRWVEPFKDHAAVDTGGDAFRAVERAIGFITLTRGVDLKRHDESILACVGKSWSNVKRVVGAILKIQQEEKSWRMPPLRPDLLGEWHLLNLARRVADQQPNWDEQWTDPVNTDAWIGHALSVDVFGTIQMIQLLAQDFPIAPETIAWTESLLRKIEPWLEDSAICSDAQDRPDAREGLFKLSSAVAQVVRTLAAARDTLEEPTQRLFLIRVCANPWTWLGALNVFFHDNSFLSSATVLKRIDTIRLALVNVDVPSADEPEIASKLCEAFVNGLTQSGEASLFDRLEGWGACLQLVAGRHPDHPEIQRLLAMGAFNATNACGHAERWVEFGTWGECLQDVAARHPDHAEIQLLLAMGAANVTHFWGGEERRAEFDAWGKCLQDVAARNPDYTQIQLLLAQGASNAIHVCGSANRWVEFDAWGVCLQGVAGRHPGHREIQLALAKGAVNATNACGRRDRWVEFDAWGECLQAVAACHPDDTEIQLELAKGTLNAISPCGGANRWVEFDAWGKCLQAAAARHPEYAAIQLLLAQGAHNAIRFCGGANRWAELDVWGKCLQAVAARYPDDTEFQLVLAESASNAIHFCGGANRWAEFDAWGKCLQAVAARYPDHAEFQVLLAEGASNAIWSCGCANRWVEFDAWGKVLQAVGARYPDHAEIQLVLAHGALNAMSGCGGAERWIEFDAWGVFQQAVASRYPNHAEIQLELANSALNAIWSCGCAKRWVEFDAWGACLQKVAASHPDRTEIQLDVARGAANAIWFCSCAKRWVGLTAWSTRLQAVAARHSDHAEIQLLLAMGATTLLFSLPKLTKKSRQVWIASLETGLKRSNADGNELFAKIVRLALEAFNYRPRRPNAVEVLVQLARFRPRFMVISESESLHLAEFVAGLPDLDEDIRRELRSLL
jgi:serine/threonine protein kinase